jgi:hypothetical protein
MGSLHAALSLSFYGATCEQSNGAPQRGAYALLRPQPSSAGPGPSSLSKLQAAMLAETGLWLKVKSCQWAPRPGRVAAVARKDSELELEGSESDSEK